MSSRSKDDEIIAEFGGWIRDYEFAGHRLRIIGGHGWWRFQVVRRSPLTALSIAYWTFIVGPL